FYDDQKRVKETRGLLVDTINKQAVVIDSSSYWYYYNGNDKNPFKTVGAVNLLPNDDAETYHFYNQLGLLIRDSLPLGDNKSYNLRRINYLGNKIILTHFSHLDGFP